MFEYDYVDRYGRYHNKPVTIINDSVIISHDPLPSNNAWIYTAYAKYWDLYADWAENVLAFHMSQTEFGFNRHPDDNTPPISFDEIVGVHCLGLVTFDMIAKWESQDWQICNLPGFKPKKWYKDLNKTIPLLWKLRPEYVAGVKIRFDGINPHRNEMWQNPEFKDVWHITFKQSKANIYFYKRSKGLKTTFFEGVHFLVAGLMSLKASKPKVMLLAKQKKIIDRTGRSGKGLNIFERILFKKIDKELKPGEEFTDYFVDHPNNPIYIEALKKCP